MIKRSIPSSRNKTSDGIAALIPGALRALADWIFAADDRAARAHGWQISRCHRGLGRLYRDPRFGLLTSCLWCRGSGRAGQQDCPACRGSGRIARGQPPHPQGGEEDDQQPIAAAR